MRSVLRVLTCGLLSALFCAAAFAQGSQTGGITGVVTDPQGAVVPGATVDVISEASGKSERRLTTGDDGSYTATLLSPGSYRLEVTAKDFKKTVVNDAVVRITETTRQDVTLNVGGVTETVEVQATESLINPTSPVTGTAINAQTMERLPLANPNVLFLLSLSAGTLSEPTDVRSAGRGTADVNVNGGRTSNNSVSLEGVNVNDFNLAHFDTVPLPNPNVLQEFKVATSLFDATQGGKGGGALGLVIKTGSKDFHYDLYWSHRNDALNANDFFFNRDGKKRPKFLQNVFGGSASGPVPGAGGFWFFNYQGVRARNGVDPLGSTTNPIVQNFATNVDGTTSAALLATQFNLSPAQIDPVAVRILNLQDARYGGTYLVPRRGQSACSTSLNGVTATDPGNFTCQFAAVAPVTDNQYTISYDRTWRDGNEKLTGRWFWDNGSIAKPYGTDTNLSFPRTDTLQNRFLSLNYTHIFTPSLISELRAGYSRFVAAQLPFDPITLGDIGATRGNSDQFPGMYRVAVTGLFSIGTGVNDDRATTSNQYNLVQTFSWIRGKHSMRFGGEGVQYQLNRFNNFSVRGSLTFGGTGTQANAFNNCRNDTNDCTAFQNFLRGRVTAIQSAFGDPARNFVATDYAAFFQDDYKFSQRLTFNIGLRWEGMSFGRDKLYRAGIYNPALAAAGRNPFLFPEKVDLAGFKGTPGVPDCALADCFDGNNWAPRVGFAWDIGGDQKNVLRGGFGLYYQRLSNQNILQNSLAAPFTVQPLDSRANPAALQLANPLASIPPPSIVASAYIPSPTFFAGLRRTAGTGPLDPNDPNVAPIFVNAAGERCLNYGGTATNCSINLASFTSAPLDAYTPYTQQWNITLQRELWKGWAAEIGYVGTHYIGGIGIWDPYQATVVSPSNPLTVRDINGTSYTITNNTVANEELRHQIIGLSRKRGSRYSGNIGQSKYNSLQLTALRRFHSGLYFQAAYTYSRTTDNVSGSLATDEFNATRAGQNGASIYNDQSNPQQNYARGDFDRPHRLVVSYSYDIPVPKGGFFDNQLFRGWTVSGITTYQKGLPFSVTDSTSGGIFGTAAGTAQFTCSSIEQAYTQGTLEQRLARYLNPACFTTAPIIPAAGFATNPGATGFGNTPRNAFRGPRQSNWDLTVAKRFTLGERHQFQFRTDFFNLFNHPVFRFPSVVNIGTPATFGLINSTAVPPRLIQFGLKYSF